jgi:hypothetical protein
MALDRNNSASGQVLSKPENAVLVYVRQGKTLDPLQMPVGYDRSSVPLKRECPRFGVWLIEGSIAAVIKPAGFACCIMALPVSPSSRSS